VNSKLVSVWIFDSNKLDAGLHQRCDEREIARQPIELRNDKPRLVTLASLQGFRQLGPIGTLAALDLDVSGDQLPRPAIQIIADGLLLRLQPKATLALGAVLTR
jgi:hypothetical protein